VLKHAALILVLARGTAHADDPPFTIGSKPAWVVLAGITTGGTVAVGDKGAYVGGELSLATLRDANFAGAYADAYYDWGVGGTWVTMGGELGHKFFGIDGGLALRFTNGETQTGITGRFTIGIGMVGLYARYAHFVDVMRDDDVIQVGLDIKLPVWSHR
jgi:hypothetical protein